MTTYKYKGQSLSGARVSGVVRAYDEFEAVAKLRDTCAFITKIEPVKERGNALDKPIGFRLKDKELALLCSQFSIILTSGLSVMRCVEMVASQTRNKYTRRMLEKVAEEVGAGYSLAQSFESNAPYLPATFIETVRAGEESGTLALCFDRLHRYYERAARTRAKIIKHNDLSRDGHCGRHHRVYHHHRRSRAGLYRRLCRPRARASCRA